MILCLGSIRTKTNNNLITLTVTVTTVFIHILNAFLASNNIDARITCMYMSM